MSFADYERCRKAGLKLNDKLMDTMISRKDVDRAAGMLGIEIKGKDMEIHSDMDLYAMVDFILCDLRDKGRSKVQAYLEDVGPDTDLERELLDMRIGSTTSLFEVKACSPRRRTVDLSDQLRGSGRDIVIYDRGLSATLAAGDSLFCRLYSGAGIHMTSGIVFRFPGEIAPELIHRYRSMRAKPNRRGPASRFALFFRMNRRYGVDVSLA